jgi:hypothetical protein
MIRQRVCIKFFATLGKSATGTLVMIKQASGEEIMRSMAKLTETDEGETGEEKSQEHAHHFI